MTSSAESDFISNIIASVRRLRTIGPGPDTVILIGRAVVGNRRRRKAARFYNRKLLERFSSSAPVSGKDSATASTTEQAK